jgi:TonB-dependent starch-binding outer membrane protein SusC
MKELNDSIKKFNLFCLFLVMTILLLFPMQRVEAQQSTQITITGIVSDSENNPLPGVTIRVKETAHGTITNFDGMYTIQVDNNNAVLQFSFVGFATQEITVGNSRIIHVTLKEDLLNLDEVVVIGYGIQKKSHLTGSVSQLRNENLAEIAVPSLELALQGKISGVTIQNTTSEAGVAPQIRVRGMGSISASNEPLVVVDGFPVSGGLAHVQMADVESIEVLKDAASAAIYGSRGANGVILITTRGGNVAKPKYTFNTYQGFKTNYRLHNILNFEDYIKLLYSEAALRMQDPSVPDNQKNRITNQERASYIINTQIIGQNTDWQSEGLREIAGVQNYQLSVSGGTREVRYFVSGVFNTDEGVMLNNQVDRFSLRAKMDAQLSKAVKVGVNISPTFWNRERPASNFTDFYRFRSFVPVRHNEASAKLTGQPEGSWAHPRHYSNLMYEGYMPDSTYWVASGILSPWSSANNNPRAILDNETRKRQEYRVMSNSYISVQLLKNLEFRASQGLLTSYWEDNVYTNLGARRDGEPNRSAYSNRLLVDVLSENTLNYNTRIGSDHSIDLMAGATYQRTNTTTAMVVGTSFPTDDVPTLNRATSIEAAETWSYKYPIVLASYLSRLNYSFKDKYLFSTSLRTDGSSLFGENRWSLFPSVSLGWRVTEESFMQNISWLDQLKPRISYGVTGNNDIEPYAYTNTLLGANYSLGTQNVIVPGLAPVGNALGNPLISWERTFEYNSGIDLSIFASRINLIFDYYYSITDKLLFKQSAMTFTGHEEFWNNIGKIRNKGVEVEINTFNIRKRNFQWNTSLNFAANRNKLIELGGEYRQLNYGERNEVYASIVGKPSIQFFGYKTDGVWKSDDEIAQAVAGGLVSTLPMVAGGLKVVDTDGNGRIDAFDRVAIGNPFPDFTFGFTNTFKIKNFDLSVMLQGVQGIDIINGDAFYTETTQINQRYVENRWVSPMFPGDGKTPYHTNGVNKMLTDFVVEDGSYISLREVIAGYRLPNNLVRRTGLTSLRIYASAQNLLYFMSSNYRGINPEARTTSSQYSSPLIDGYQRGGFPVQRVISFGLETTF